MTLDGPKRFLLKNCEKKFTFSGVAWQSENVSYDICKCKKWVYGLIICTYLIFEFKTWFLVSNSNESKNGRPFEKSISNPPIRYTPESLAQDMWLDLPVSNVCVFTQLPIFDCHMRQLDWVLSWSDPPQSRDSSCVCQNLKSGKGGSLQPEFVWGS